MVESVKCVRAKLETLGFRHDEILPDRRVHVPEARSPSISQPQAGRSEAPERERAIGSLVRVFLGRGSRGGKGNSRGIRTKYRFKSIGIEISLLQLVARLPSSPSARISDQVRTRGQAVAWPGNCHGQAALGIEIPRDLPSLDEVPHGPSRRAAKCHSRTERQSVTK